MTFTFNFHSRDMVLPVSYLVLQKKTIFQILFNKILLILFFMKLFAIAKYYRIRNILMQVQVL